MNAPSPSWREAFDIVEEAAMGGAEAHTGPSNMSTGDYERHVVRALNDLEQHIVILRAGYDNYLAERNVWRDKFYELEKQLKNS